MSRGRLFGCNGRVYGTAGIAQLMEEGKTETVSSDCEVWKMDVEHYNRTGEVRKLEHLRTEPRIKATKSQVARWGEFV